MKKGNTVMFMKKQFRDAEGRVIRDGARVYFTGEFPKEQKVLDEALYNKYGVKHPREGVVFIVDNKLGFATHVNGKMQATGLCWELDGERCHDLVVID
jgi:hypothetical protein